jgi:hypothetical protein
VQFSVKIFIQQAGTENFFFLRGPNPIIGGPVQHRLKSDIFEIKLCVNLAFHLDPISILDYRVKDKCHKMHLPGYKPLAPSRQPITSLIAVTTRKCC